MGVGYDWTISGNKLEKIDIILNQQFTQNWMSLLQYQLFCLFVDQKYFILVEFVAYSLIWFVGAIKCKVFLTKVKFLDKTSDQSLYLFKKDFKKKLPVHVILIYNYHLKFKYFQTIELKSYDCKSQ